MVFHAKGVATGVNLAIVLVTRKRLFLSSKQLILTSGPTTEQPSCTGSRRTSFAFEVAFHSNEPAYPGVKARPATTIERTE